MNQDKIEDNSVASPIDTDINTAVVPEFKAHRSSNNLFSRKAFTRKRLGFLLAGLLLVGGVGFVVIRSNEPKVEKADRKGKNQVTPVTVTKVIRKTVPVQISAIGTVQADAAVSVTPQTGGRITGVFFKKGQEVRKGDLLFTLDERSQNAAVQQATGTVNQAQSQVQQTRATANKNLGLVKQAEATVNRDLGLVAQARATLKKDQGLVGQAQAVLKKDQAQADFAMSQSKRYGDLAASGAISRDLAQQYVTNAAASQATLQADREAIATALAVVKSDEIAITNAQSVVEIDRVGVKNANSVVNGDAAAIETAQAVVSTNGGALGNAQVLASYTKIYAPIDGRAGNVLVPEGTVVQANGNIPLVVLQKIRPIQVAFSVPESNLSTIQKRMSGRNLKVDVTFAGNEKKSISGTLSFINNTVDNATGTIQLIGDFDNTDGKLFPGQFVNATLTLSQEVDATIVPSQAVQNGPDGQFVFRVKDDNTVENVPVTAIATIDGQSLIQKGVKPGDQVVTDGQGNLVTGSKIQIKEENAKPTTGENADTNSKDAKPANGDTPPEGKKRRGKGKKSSESSAPAGGNL
jgi:multidrug efflux system membrane fusion protein